MPFVPLANRSSSNSTEEQDRKKAKKNPAPSQQLLAPKEAAKDSKLHKPSSGEIQETSKEAGKSRESCKHKTSSRKHKKDPHLEKVIDKI